MGKLRETLAIIGGIIVVLCVSILFFVPFPARVKGNAEAFDCLWEDGTSTAEESVCEITILDVARERILFERDGKRGFFETGAEFRRAVDLFEERDAFSLLTFRLGECSKIEHLALLKEYGNICYYASGPLTFDGRALLPTTRTKFDTIVLLYGALDDDFLENSGAERVIYGKDVEKDSLMGSDSGGER